MSMFKIVTAGILAVPSLLVMVVTAPVVAILGMPALALLCFQPSDAPRRRKDNNKEATTKPTQEHAIITGGSTGIGFAIAQECVKRGMTQVTILARTKSKLEDAVKQLQQIKPKGSATVISYRSLDVSDEEALNVTAQELCGGSDNNNNNNATVKYYIFCCAGQAFPGYFDHLPSTVFAKLTQINQLGAIYTTQAFLPHMQHGIVVLTSSMAGQVGTHGFTAYSPTKFALRGFAESLHAELSDNPSIRIQVAFPPDTDTPGFHEEEKFKPKECRLISETAGLSQPQDIAQQMVQAAVVDNPAFLVYFTFDGWMVSALTAGFSPVSTLLDAVAQVSLGGLFRFIALFYLNDWWRMIRNSAQERIDNNQEKERPSWNTNSASSKSNKKD